MPVERDEVIERLSRLPDRLERLVEQHPSDLLCQPGAGGGWGAVEIMAFLRDWNEMVSERIEMMLNGEPPEFADEDTDLWPIERDYHDENPNKVVQEVRDGRTDLVEMLERLDDQQWERTGRMPDGTIVTLEDLVRNLDEHDKAQMKALRDLLL